MTITTWPAPLIPRSCNPELRNAARSGGVALSGQEQRVMSMAARWEVTYEFPINTTAQVKAYRALIARLRMGEDVIATVFDMHKPGNFGGDTGTLAVAAALRATTIELEGPDVAIDAGQHISLGGNRLYLVTNVDTETSINLGLVLAVSGSDNWDDAEVWIDDPFGTATIDIVPPTRAAYADGATVDLNVLKLRCVLKEINSGDLGLEYGRFGTASLTLTESI